MKNTVDTTPVKTALPQRLRLWLTLNFRTDSKDVGHIALNGLFYQNPVFVLLLGLCPALAVTTSLYNGLGMGLSTAAVLLCSNLVVSLLRSVIPNKLRFPSYLIIIAVFAAAAGLLMQALTPNLSDSLGLYVPLIAFNGLILGRTEIFASQNPPGKACLDGLFSGLGFAGALAILGAVREILGAGTLWGVPVPVLSEYPVGMILSPCGGFFTLGFLIALVQFIRRLGAAKRKRGDRHESY